MSAWRADATISSTTSSTGRTAVLAMIARSSNDVRRRMSVNGIPARGIYVERESEHRHVEHERRHAKAHERERDAGQRNDRKVAGDSHGELAQRQDDPHHAKPAQKSLVVVDDPPAQSNEARLAACRVAVTSNDQMQPQCAA